MTSRVKHYRNKYIADDNRILKLKIVSFTTLKCTSH